MRKYFEIFKYSLKTQLTFIVDYLISLISFAIHVFIFNELWDYILKGKLVAGYTKNELIWYIIIAECVSYSFIVMYKKIGQMVKQGDIANMLIKPVNVVNYFMAEGMSSIIKCFINMILGVILGICFTGGIEANIWIIFLTIISILVGMVIGVVIQVFVGILAFFTEENQSFYLVIQKLSFFAVFTPLEFYPKIIQNILYYLPPVQMVYAPSRIFAKCDVKEALVMLGTQVLSGVALFIILKLLYKKGAEKINVNGG